MKPRRIVDGIDWMGFVDWDARLFDALIPLPDGTSYNAYLVRGSEKTVLIDTVESPLGGYLASQLEGVERLDYVISLHSEQDHSGSIPQVLARFPEAKVITHPRARKMLGELLGVSAESVITVKDGERLSLGDRELEFVHTPWVHWPETMVAYLRPDRILFSCDFFGSHLATSDLFVTEEAPVYEAAKRYYAEIMMPYARLVGKNLEKLAPYDLSLIAPSHGPVYPRPSFIVEAHREWVLGPPRNRVVLPYVSMHGSTRRMVEALVEALVDKGVGVRRFDLTVTDLGQLAIALVDAGTVVLGTPTVLGGPHPHAAHAAYLIHALHPKAGYFSMIGSYGWGGRTRQIVQDMMHLPHAEMLDPVMVRGLPSEQDLRALEALAETIAERHRARGWV